MPVKAVLFDLDGTLVDSNDMHVHVWQRVFGEFGLDAAQDAIHAQIGKGGDLLVPALFPAIDKTKQKAVTEMHGEVFKTEFLERVVPFPHARDLLMRVHEEGQMVVLASSASQVELDRYLDLLDVRAIVAAATSIDDVRHSKPAPDIFASALKKVAPLTAKEAIAVGDTPYDAQAANHSGISTIALRSGKFPDWDLIEAGIAALYDDVGALLANYETSPLAR